MRSKDTHKMMANAASTSKYCVTVQPSGRAFDVETGEAVLTAGIRQGIGLPYGCKDGACGSCKCKMLSGSVVHGAHQSKALSAEEEANDYVLTCCAAPQSDLILESRQVTELGALPIKKMPTRVSSLTKKSPDVVAMQLQLPSSDTFAYRAGQCTAHGAGAGTAHSPHAWRQVHRPCFQRHEREGNSAH
jgi:CDP-4-dehydro-6-deoxyglucose reductase